MKTLITLMVCWLCIQLAQASKFNVFTALKSKWNSSKTHQQIDIPYSPLPLDDPDMAHPPPKTKKKKFKFKNPFKKSNKKTSSVSVSRSTRPSVKLAKRTNNTTLAKALAAFQKLYWFRRKATVEAPLNIHGLDIDNLFLDERQQLHNETFLKGYNNKYYLLHELISISDDLDQNSSLFRAEDVATGQVILLKNSEQLGLHELSCLNRVKLLYDKEFKENTYYGSIWVPIMDLPGRSLATELMDEKSSFSPDMLYYQAKEQIRLVHQHFSMFIGDTHAYNFVVDPQRGHVTLMDYAHCGTLSNVRFNIMVEDYRLLAEHVYHLVSHRSDRQLHQPLLNQLLQDVQDTVASNQLRSQFNAMFPIRWVPPFGGHLQKPTEPDSAQE